MFHLPEMKKTNDQTIFKYVSFYIFYTKYKEKVKKYFFLLKYLYSLVEKERKTPFEQCKQMGLYLLIKLKSSSEVLIVGLNCYWGLSIVSQACHFLQFVAQLSSGYSFLGSTQEQSSYTRSILCHVQVQHKREKSTSLCISH